jgi:hypothetical protein
MDGAELVYQPTPQSAWQNARLESAPSELITPQSANPPTPLSNFPQAETFTAPPAIFAAPRSLGLPFAAAVVLLAVVVFLAHYASSRVFSITPEASANNVETQNPKLSTADPQSVPAAGRDGASQSNDSSSSPSSDQSPSPESPSSSPSSQTPTNSGAPSSSLNPEEYQVATATAPLSARNSRSAHAAARTRSAIDKRLTIPRLAQLTTLPRVPPLRRLQSTNSEKNTPGSASTDAKEFITHREAVPRPVVIQSENQKLAVAGAKPVNYRPAGADEKKQSRIGSFLKKTGRILTKPFRDKL